MIGEPIVEVTISGQISTNSNKQNVQIWKQKLEESFSILSAPLSGRKLSVEMKFWLDKSRLNKISKNDVDNLVKPVLDSMKRVFIIEDDAFVYQLKVTKFSTQGSEQLVMVIKEWLT